MKKIFGGYASAVKDGEVLVKPVTVTGYTYDEAIINLMEQSVFNIFPVDEDWRSHKQELIEMSFEQACNLYDDELRTMAIDYPVTLEDLKRYYALSNNIISVYTAANMRAKGYDHLYVLAALSVIACKQ